MSQNRRQLGKDFKADVDRRHLAGKEPVSKLAEEFGLQPSQIHTWVHQVLAQAEQAFERSGGNGRSELSTRDRRIEQLEAKLVQKNEVIAELMEDNVLAKKAAGEL